MTAQRPFVTTIDANKHDQLRKDLIEQGFTLSQPPHTVFSAKKAGIACTLYQSGKLTVQGKQMDEFIEFYLEPQILGEMVYTYPHQNVDPTKRIGIDESGKGDVFGPLCIAGVCAEGDAIRKLLEMGVCDSKKINDKTIHVLAKKIKENYPHHVIRINPFRYNEIYNSFGNLNHLLAWGHASTIEKLAPKAQCDRVIVDQFAAEYVLKNALAKKKLQLTLTQRPRAEEDPVVAAASILAREAFLTGLEMLSKQWGIALPKGASSKVISVGRQFVKEHGREALPQVTKMHFKTLDAILKN